MEIIRTTVHQDVCATRLGYYLASVDGQNLATSVSGLAEATAASAAEVDAYSILTRHAARAIVMRGADILLLFTERYQDYSLPGGGVDQGETIEQGLIRELQEETGATGVRNIQPFTRYDEYRPWHKAGGDVIHMISHCYVCDIDATLGRTSYEHYEVKNGMRALWVNIHQAISHNQHIIAYSDKKGLSIERETFLLKLIAERLLSNDG